MNDEAKLTEHFENHRPRLRALAYRMLGSLTDAEDAVQEAWLRLHRTEIATVENLGAWLTTVVSRVCLDLLRSRKARREDPMSAPAAGHSHGVDPESEALLADSVGVALLVVLETLTPAERLAFVLHDLFGMPFDELAPIVGRSPQAARQLASRARRRVRGAPAVEVRRERQRELVEAFLAAARTGEVEGLLAVLDREAVLRIDAAAAHSGEERELRGAESWVRQFVALSRGMRSVQPALIDGSVGLIHAPAGKLERVLTFTCTDTKVTRIEVIADPARLRQLAIGIL